MLPWYWFVLTLSLAFILGWLWYRAREALRATQHQLTQLERMVRTQSNTLDQYQTQQHAIMEATAQAILILSPARHVLALNTAAQMLFGPQAILGQSLIAATRSVELDDLAAHCLQDGADCDRQVALGLSNQPYRARAVRAGATEPGVIVLVLQDLSELQRLGRARRDFVANISHELRTPITSIRLLVDTLRGPISANAQARDGLLEKIAVETEALAQLAQELLDLAQMESGQTLIRLVPVNLNPIVDTVVARLRPQAERKQHHIEVVLPEAVPVLADPDQINRVLGNLLHNAIKFTPPNGQIWVRALVQAQPPEAIVEVADNGPGVAPELLQRVFERFFRGDKSRAGGGTGLGLAIAKHVVEAHGGKIWAESTGRPGQGVMFRFTLLLANEK